MKFRDLEPRAVSVAGPELKSQKHCICVCFTTKKWPPGRMRM